MDNESFFAELNISEAVKKKLKNKRLLQKEFAQGKSAQEIIGFSSHIMSKLYAAANHLFEKRHFEEAGDAFFFLITLNTYNSDYWLGFGMATQMCGDFDLAMDAYEMASICSIENPIPYFYLAKCLFALHDRESAKQALQLAIDYSGENPKFLELKGQAIEAKKYLKKISKKEKFC